MISYYLECNDPSTFVGTEPTGKLIYGKLVRFTNRKRCVGSSGFAYIFVSEYRPQYKRQVDNVPKIEKKIYT